MNQTCYCCAGAGLAGAGEGAGVLGVAGALVLGELFGVAGVVVVLEVPPALFVLPVWFASLQAARARRPRAGKSVRRRIIVSPCWDLLLNSHLPRWFEVCVLLPPDKS